MLARPSLHLFATALLGSVIVVALLGADTARSRTAQTTAAATGQPMLIPHVLNVNCTSLASVTPTFAKLVDIGTFPVQSSASIVEVTFNGRVTVLNFDATASGAAFELRIDNAATTHGRARASFKRAEAGSDGAPVSMTGIFTNLAPGNHTVSVWVRSFHGNGTSAIVDPGCWPTDHVVIKEYTPFGLAFMPAIHR